MFAAPLLAAALSCELGEQAQAQPSATCREFGSLCDLGGGALGVCESRTCGAQQTPPCFVCTPQH